MKIGVDTGGTFTDFVWAQEGRLRIHKEMSSPEDPSRAVLDGLGALEVPEKGALVHGSTVATNALLEGRGSRTALIATEGFGDVLAIGRQNRPELYALVPHKPEPLVPRRWRFEVRERVTAQGEILQPLVLDDLLPILRAIEGEGIQSVAVSLLFSFLRPQHEQRIREWLLEKTGAGPDGGRLHVSLSCEILPEYREYERTSTTVINAYVAPLMDRYLGRVARGVAPRPLSIMQSNGGIISAQMAGAQAARTVLSGPAGGVVGARYVAEKAGYSQIMTLDMGGTSTDVALCPGRLPTTARGEIAGMPLRLPIIDIHTVGAGGGSLARVDGGGALHVGPQSAGARPGPVCYGREASDWELEIDDHLLASSPSPLYVTTTDANLILGRLDADHFLGGSMGLELERAQAALRALAQKIGARSAEAAAWDVVRVANATMERAMRRISVERGHDPRRFTLVAFGGAGPLHACELARSLRIPRVLIPAVPGVLSALGMLVAPPTRDYSQTVMRRLNPHAAAEEVPIEDDFSPLVARAGREMAAEGHEREQLSFQRSLDMRYAGQSHELTVSYAGSTRQGDVAELLHAAHERRYGFRQEEAPVEIVNVRLRAKAPATRPQLPQETPQPGDASDLAFGRRPVWFGSQAVSTALYQRRDLKPGHTFGGPAVVFQYDTTTVVPPDWRAEIDPFGNLLLSV